MTSASKKPPAKVIVENLKYVLPPPNATVRKHKCHNNKRSAMTCSVIWLMLSMSMQFYTVMAIVKTIYGANLVTEDYKEEIVRHKQNTSTAGLLNEMKLCASMKKETIILSVLLLYATLAMLNIMATICNIWGILKRLSHWTVPYIFTSGMTLVIFVTSHFILAFTQNESLIFATRGGPVLMGLAMVILMLHPIFQSSYLIEKAQSNNKTLVLTQTPRVSNVIRTPRVKSRGGLIHTVSKVQTTEPLCPKKMAVEP